MKIVGLTGGIGSGKTTVAKMFEAEGIPIYIADDRAKYIMDRQDVIDRIQAVFPINVLDALGKLDRRKIREVVFDNKSLLNELNSIVHPEVKKDFLEFVQANQAADFIIKESAILFEKGLDRECDFTILVTAPEEIRIERVKKRDNTTEDSIRQIIANQWDDLKKKSLSDYIIENIDMKLVKECVISIVNDIKLRKNSI
ncbi:MULTISPECIES: dephospho-CoA kinase [Myroides]|uniref:Dephospho-CoA kinase n=1 Tax=Myroides albus TaxID=2562892 RepID=A0A6I3LH06_9FLAO|nr:MULTISPECIES: dephospho-CoA kinase [Myroides]MTG97778.1 dephospho-CoA kinase [Myroides albus]MVX35538.1 dephospho-CoA kinase [Myroides sp. LoEW2-1]UVD79734.1 dephospho-CoA kinase [Myroides albus]